MYEDIFKVIISALIPIVIGWIRSKYGDPDSKIKDEAFEFILPILKTGVKKSNCLEVEYRFEKFLKYKLSYNVIEKILSSTSPLLLFRKYKRAMIFVEYNDILDIFEYRNGYKKQKKRIRLKRFKGTLYFIFALITILLLVYSVTLINAFGFEIFPVLVLMLLLSLPLTYLSLDEGLKLIEAENFISLAEKLFDSENKDAGLNRSIA